MKISVARPSRLLILQMVVILLIAGVSAYEVPDFSKIDTNIVLFLTPYGILTNLWSASSPLRPFYHEIATGQSQLTLPIMAGLACLYCILLFNFVLISKNLRRR